MKSFYCFPRLTVWAVLLICFAARLPLHAQLRFEFPMTIDQTANMTARGLVAMPDGGVAVEKYSHGPGVVFNTDLAPRFNILKYPYCPVSSDTIICVDDGSITSTNHLLQKFTAGVGYDPTFNSPPYAIYTINGNEINSSDYVLDIKVQPDGKVIYCQNTTVRRLLADGKADSSFPSLYGSRILMLPDGRFLLDNVRRYLADGTRDVSFADVTLDAACNSLALTPDGGVVIAGAFQHVNGSLRANVARLFSDGTLDFSFRPYTNAQIAFTRVAVQSDGKVICGNLAKIVRINADGTIDRSFSASTGQNDMLDFCLDTRQRVVYSAYSIPLARLSGRNRIVAQPGSVPIVIERSSSIDSGWSTLLAVPAQSGGDYIDDSYPGTGNSFYRVRPAN